MAQFALNFADLPSDESYLLIPSTAPNGPAIVTSGVDGLPTIKLTLPAPPNSDKGVQTSLKSSLSSSYVPRSSSSRTPSSRTPSSRSSISIKSSSSASSGSKSSHSSSSVQDKAPQPAENPAPPPQSSSLGPKKLQRVRGRELYGVYF